MRGSSVTRHIAELMSAESDRNMYELFLGTVVAVGIVAVSCQWYIVRSLFVDLVSCRSLAAP